MIFTGIISMIFLKRKLTGYHWLGMLLVLLGTILVGLASVIDGGKSAGAPNPVLGDILVIAAQVNSIHFQFCFHQSIFLGYCVCADGGGGKICFWLQCINIILGFLICSYCASLYISSLFHR